MAESFVSLRVSKNGGYTWSDWHTRSLGETGSFAREAIWRRLGNSRQFTFSFRADGVPDIVSASILGVDGQWGPAPIAQGAYADHARLWTYQDTCNYIPVRVERPGATAEWILRGAPGYRLFANVGDGPIRGARDVEGKLLVVSGTEVYLVNRDTSTTLLGTLPGEGRVTITHNQEGGGSKVVFANGTRGYTYDTITGTYAQITDEAFPGFLVCEYLDQYILGIEPQRRYAFHSELADADEYSSIDVFEAEGAPDRLMGQAVIGGQWWLFGERTTEIFANTGASTGTFQRIQGATIDRGLASTHAVAKLDNALWILGDDGIVYRSNGYGFVRVSTHAIEHALRLVDQTKVFFQTFEDAGHKILYVTCPDGNTWGFDVATQEWHRRESAGLSRWRMNVLVKWAGVWLVGDHQHGKLYQLDWALKDEDGTTLTGVRTTGTLVNAGNRFTVSGVKVLCDTGRGEEALTGVRAIIDPLVIYNPLGEAYVGVAVSHQYGSTGGVRPHTFAISAGSLPTGLSMDSAGLVTGTCTVAGDYAWRVTVTDAQGFTASLDEGQDAGEGIDGDVFYVYVPPPTLITDSDAYGEDPDALENVGTMGWPAGINRVRFSHSGLYAVGSDMGDAGADRFVILKYDRLTETWDRLAAPADMPTTGPHEMAWAPDDGYLALAMNSSAPPNSLLVYKVEGDTFTKLDDPDTLPSNALYTVAWDSAGQRLACGNANGAAPIVVYDFYSDALHNYRAMGDLGGYVCNRLAFLDGVGSRYLAWAADGRVGVVAVTETPMRNAVQAATRGETGCHWDSAGNVLFFCNNGAGPEFITRADFDGSVIGSETLTVLSAPASQPATGVIDSSMRQGLYLAVATQEARPLIYEIDTVAPADATQLANPPDAAAVVNSVSWSEFNT